MIAVVGVGPGHPDYLTAAARRAIEEAEVLAGGERVLQTFQKAGQPTFVIKNNLGELVDFLGQNRARTRIAVLASGDPAFFGILEFLKRHFPVTELRVIPGISSMQAACARLGLSWHDAAFFSVHGRAMGELADWVRTHPKVVVLTDPGHSPAAIARTLLAAGISRKVMHVAEHLTYENEQVAAFRLTEVPPEAGRTGCVVVIVDEQ